MIDPAKLGWAAAILDLQGHVVQKKNPTRATPQVVLIVDTASVIVVQGLCALTGSNVEMKQQKYKLPQQWKRRACTEHCPEAHVHMEVSMPLTGRWTVTGVAAAIVLHNLRPYLLTWDAKGWGVAYEQCMDTATLTGQGSGATRPTIARLAGLGWDLPAGWAQMLMDPQHQPRSWDNVDDVRRLVADEQRRRRLALEA